jgi:transketolase
MNSQNYKNLASALIVLGIDAIEKAKSGHPGAIMGMSDFVTVLFANHLRFSAKNPHWHNRDRFILSNGHVSMMLYGLLYLTGYERPTIEDIKNFRQLGSVTAGHPEYGHIDGIETTTGPLGQGFANSVGMAIAQKKTHELFKSNGYEGSINNKIYVTVGDGCLMEGISHEAASLAGHLKLNNLIVLFDSNQISIDGSTNLSDSTNTKQRFLSYNWHVIEANGHDYDEIENAYIEAKSIKDKPTLIIFNTVIANHANKKRGSASSHGAPLGSEEIQFVKSKIEWTKDYKEFEIPESLLSEWRAIGSRYDEEANDWNDKYLNFLNKQKDFSQCFDEIEKIKNEYKNFSKDESTRKSSGNFLEKITKFIPSMIGGSADLSESNCTKTSDSHLIDANDFSGNYIHYGIREHGMAAIMNGIACYGGFISYGGGFLIFSDYAKPSIRLSALMGLQVIHVLTHDSIGLGEDGPTHQPIEQLIGLRSIPNLLVFRPADAMETICSWEIALKIKNQPSAIICSRQNLKQITNNENIYADVEKGGYIISNFENNGKKKIVILATGSELSIAMNVKERLDDRYDVRVVSMVCTNLFDKQDKKYQSEILMLDNEIDLRIAIEAGSEAGWWKYLNFERDLFFGISDRFGASGKAEDLYKYFGLDAEQIEKKIEEKLK